MSLVLLVAVPIRALRLRSYPRIGGPKPDMDLRERSVLASLPTGGGVSEFIPGLPVLCRCTPPFGHELSGASGPLDRKLISLFRYDHLVRGAVVYRLVSCLTQEPERLCASGRCSCWLSSGAPRLIDQVLAAAYWKLDIT